MKKVILAALFLGCTTFLFAQRKARTTSIPKSEFASVLKQLEFREIGPFRGGRSCAVTGVKGKPNLYYFGATGGGVWRTQDGGRTWKNISDSFFGGSIGSIAVSEWDENVIYVGGGEVTVRGNASSGDGMWRSTDAGRTWQRAGLEKSRHIARIRVHPRNADMVYAAVMGNIYKPTKERGVYRSKDGGKTWEQILFANEHAGAVDLTFDPNNPRILYATTWRIKRSPYDLSSGGEGSGIWKSTDGGDTWENISRNEGLPQKDILGIAGITVSPQNSDRVWAILEAENGGVFRSENGGKTWRKVNTSRSLRQRAWYYTRIYADPLDEDVVYVLNVRWHKSTDGGKTFKAYGSPHGDHHDLWLDPNNSKRLVIADDGGAQVSYDGGLTWTTYHNQPTAQFYRVTTDNSFPYRIYAAQQDNSTIRINHRSNGWTIGKDDWESTAGCECGHIAIDPRNNDIVYGGCYDGYLQRKDHETGLSRAVSVWPDNPMGHGAKDWKYRFQWNFPIFISPHDPNKLYTASNHLHLSTNEGQSWTTISPDLTRNDSTKLGSSGGPITQDNTSVEYYCTIFAAVESPRVEGLIWIGSDDGLVHLTRDGGENWENITPTNLPEWTMINSIEADPHNDGGAYLVATSYKMGDFKPYLYRTKDYGKTWTKITQRIDNEHFTRVLRADPVREGLLFAGTENGLYVSFNDGLHWQLWQQNLPIVPITDMTIKENNLVIATQGRSIWVLDDLTPFHQWAEEIARKESHLFQPMDTYRMPGSRAKSSLTAGTNRHPGVMTFFYLKEKPADSVEVRLSYHEANGDLIKAFSTKAKDKNDPEKRGKLKVEEGSNFFTWNMRYPDAEKFEGIILWWASLAGPKAKPGKYTVRLQVGDTMQEQPFIIKADPRSPSQSADYEAQFDFMMDISNKVSEAHDAIKDIRDVRKQMKAFTDRLDKEEEKYKPLFELQDSIFATMKSVEENLYQTKNRSNQDPLNFPIKLTNKLAHLNSLVGQSDYPPTQQAIEVKNEMIGLIDAELAQWMTVKEDLLPQFNQLIVVLKVPAVRVED